jgi:hypothetical protein
MKLNKILPVLLLVAMVILTFLIKRCNNSNQPDIRKRQPDRQTQSIPNAKRPAENTGGLDRTTTKLFFTKHAKCRMKCRHITQKEVKEILLNGTVNYNKSDLQDSKGPTYAVEGMTGDRQHVRIIFAPKQQHLTVVTVIDLDEDYECSCA